jgi:hypothetical protein
MFFSFVQTRLPRSLREARAINDLQAARLMGYLCALR